MAFDLPAFVHSLLSQILFYDVEYGILGILSLIDPERKQEMYIASFEVAEERFIIEEATEWEEDDEGGIGYSLAVGSNVIGRYDTHEETAAAVLKLAEEHGLWPSLTVGVDEEANA